MATRDDKGRFIKGKGGNPTGRPKSAKLTQEDRDNLVKIVKDNVEEAGLLKELLSFMLERAEYITDVHKYFKEYAPYLSPKLSSIKQEIKEERVIKVLIEGFEKPLEMVDKTPEKVIEHNNNEEK